MSENEKPAVNSGNVNAQQLNSYFDRLERLEQEIKDLRADCREIFAEAKGNGFDPKIMRQIMRLRRMNPADRAEIEFLLDAYKTALGMD